MLRVRLKQKGKVMQIQYKLISILLILLSSILSATVYEDAEDGLIDRWSVYNNASGTASIKNVLDSTTKEKVIEFSAENMSDGFKIGGIEGEAGAWDNNSETTLTWDFKYNNRSSMYVRVDTNVGAKYLYYGFGIADEVSSNGLYIRHNLGDRPANGTWLHFERDIAADVAAFFSGFTLTKINGFFVNGSGSIDNLQLTKTRANRNIYEDAEDSSTNRWRVFSNVSGIAAIENNVDAITNSRVIEFTAENMSDGFIIGGIEGEAEAWNNTTTTMMKWDFKYNNRSSIYVRVDTNHGAKYLYYGFGIADEISSNGRYIRHNLGDRPANGTWLHFERDIAADVAAFSTGNVLSAINGFVVNGSGSIDNLMFSSHGNNIPLLVSAGADKSIELGSTLKLVGTVTGGDANEQYTYTWKDANDNVLSNTLSLDYTPTQVTKEVLSLTVTNNGMTKTDFIEVTVTNPAVQVTQEITLCKNKSAYIDTFYKLGMTINSTTAHGSVLSKNDNFVAAVLCGEFSTASSSSNILNSIKNTAFPTAINILSATDATNGSIKARYELKSIDTQAYAVLKSILQASGENDFSNYIDYSALAKIKDLYIDIYVEFVDVEETHIVVAITDQSENNANDLNGLVDRKNIRTSNSNNVETDSFTYTGNVLKADILFVMDDSGSMSDEQAAASTAIISTFGTAMTRNGVDWKATVIGTEKSRNYLQKHIDDPSENNITKLSQQLRLGTNGYDEVGLKKAYDYLSNADIVIRNGSKLSIVLISDEIEHTRLQQDLGVATIADSYFVTNNIQVNAIIPEDNNYAGGGSRASDLAFNMTNTTGGEVANLRNYATGYDAMMQKIADNAAGSASSIILTRTPIISSISVSIDGVVVANGWNYNSSNNSIVFDALSAPASGAVISVTYNY